MGLNRRNGALAAGFLVAAMCALASAAHAFDTGPHFDITEDVLRSEGFSPTAIQTVQSANFFVDFYEFMGTDQVRKYLTTDCRALMPEVLRIGDAQHFDDLIDTQQVSQKWDAMLDATKRTAEGKAQTGDVLGLLALLGMSLHNVQDFYAHSNWVDGGYLGPPLGKGALAKYGDHPTWLSMDRKDREALDVYTSLNRPSIQRSHGYWDSDSLALNKDWAGRPHYNDAYVCAYFATRQWVRLFQAFVNRSAVWSKMRQFDKSSFDPSRDWDYARKISFYGGHWNGNGGPPHGSAFSSRNAATSPDFLAVAVIGFLGGRCISEKPSALRAEVEHLLLSWGDAPYRTPIDVTLPSAAPESLQFVQLKVHSVFATHGSDGFLGGQMDWYSRAGMDGQRFWSGLIDEHDQFDFDHKPYAPWTMTKAVPYSTRDIGVTFQLMELDRFDDDQVDINPGPGLRSLVIRYAPATGEVRGDVSTATGQVRRDARFTMEGKGDCDCARVIMSVEKVRGACLR
jgi:hypothetical protein